MQGTPVESKGETREETRGETREKTKEKILAAIKADPEVTTQELAKYLSLSIKGVEWNLKKLKTTGLLRRVGSTKSGHWEVLEK